MTEGNEGRGSVRKCPSASAHPREPGEFILGIAASLNIPSWNSQIFFAALDAFSQGRDELFRKEPERRAHQNQSAYRLAGSKLHGRAQTLSKHKPGPQATSRWEASDPPTVTGSNEAGRACEALSRRATMSWLSHSTGPDGSDDSPKIN